MLRKACEWEVEWKWLNGFSRTAKNERNFLFLLESMKSTIKQEEERKIIFAGEKLFEIEIFSKGIQKGEG